MALEALWAVTFGTGYDGGNGILIFETGRIFGGDSSFYYIGTFTYNPRDETMSGEAQVIRHAPGRPFIFAGYDGGTVRLHGQRSEPIMMLTGVLMEDPRQTIVVYCRHLADLP